MVTAGGLLNENVDTLLISGLGCAIVAAHGTDEVVGCLLVAGVQAQLVSSAGSNTGHIGGLSGLLRLFRLLRLLRLGATALSVQTSDVVSILQLGGLQNTHGHKGAISTDVANLTADGGVQRILLCIPSEYGACAGAELEVLVGAAGNQIDILLGTAGVQEVQMVTAGSFLNEHINTLLVSGVSCAVVAAHCTGEVVGSILISGMQTQLVSSARNNAGHIGGLSGNLGFLGLLGLLGLGAAAFASSCEPCAELADANLAGILDIAGLRGRYSLVGTIGTQIPVGAIDSGLNILVLSVQNINSMLTGGLEHDIGLSCIVGAGNDIQISLGGAIHEVDVVTTGGLFQIYINHLRLSLSGCIVEAAHLAGNAQNRRTGNAVLLHSKLVSSASNRSIHKGQRAGSLRNNRGLLGSGSVSGLHEVSNKLSHACVGGIIAGDVVDAGDREGGVTAVSTHEVQIVGDAAVDSIGVSLAAPVEGNSGFFNDSDSASLLTVISGVLIDFDVLLDIAVHEEETVAVAVGPLNGNLNSIAGVGGSCQILAIHLAGEVVIHTIDVHEHIVALAHINQSAPVVGNGLCGGLATAGNAAVQSTTGIELDSALVVDNVTGNGNGIANSNLSNFIALQAVC